MGYRTGVMLSLAMGFQLALGLCFFPATQADAADAKWIGEFKNWSAYVARDGKNRICYAHSEPEKSAGEYKRRGDIFLQVTHRTATKVRNEVAVTAGYTYKKDSEAEIEIDGKKFSLFTDRDGAWARETKTDAAIVKAMIRGSKLTLRGESSRGTKTTDQFSLMGFTAAYKAIGKACDIN